MGTSVSSYINTKTKYIVPNAICYADLITKESNDWAILIEKEKIKYPIETVEQYFNNLLKADILIGKFKYLENGDIIVFINSKQKRERLLVVSMVRYLWEGHEKNSNDKYYQIFEHFMNLCKYYPEKDFFKLLMFATNLFSFHKHYIDTDHCIMGHKKGTIIISKKELMEKKKLNYYFSDCLFIIYKNESFESPEKIENYSTKEHYDNAFELFFKHNPEYKF